MSNTRKWLLGCGVALVLGALAIFAVLYIAVARIPRTSKAEASIEIAAPAEAIRARLENLETWSEWSGWKRDVDPEVMRTFHAPEGGAGASMRWTPPEEITISFAIPPKRVSTQLPNEDLGSGALSIVSSSADRVELSTLFENGLVIAGAARDGSGGPTVHAQTPGSNYTLRSLVRLESTPGGTRVTWTDELDLGEGFTRGMLALFLGPASESVHREILADSLQGLKAAVETEAK
jgi:hypothetical protein